MKKVAIIDTLGEHEGSFHFYTFGQCIGLINNNIDVSLYTNNKTKNPNIKKLKFYNYYNNLFSSRFKLVSGFRWIIGSLKSIIHARISSISFFHFHIFYINILVIFNILLVKILFGKVVVTIHDVHSFSNQVRVSFAKKVFYALTDLILTHNKFSKNEITKIISGPLNIHIVPHGNYLPFINIEKDKSKSKKKLNLPENKRIILFFGLIKEVKGLEVLLKSLREVVNKHKDIRLLIAGKSWKNNFSRYQKIIDDEKLNDYCILHTKFIPQSLVKYYYAASDLVVLPYKRIYQSGVLMMTLSYNKPVLVSDLPPLTEVINDKFNGYVFKSEDSENLTLKLNEIFFESEKLLDISNQGFKEVKEKFDWNSIGYLTDKAYGSIY
tara:strand:- start:7001 stop:8143 length:1143 start_codon:yes stop_codon:yes gene_type:complete